jgi:cell division protein FtsI/penicillin-binding protein 2
MLLFAVLLLAGLILYRTGGQESGEQGSLGFLGHDTAEANTGGGALIRPDGSEEWRKRDVAEALASREGLDIRQPVAEVSRGAHRYKLYMGADAGLQTFLQGMVDKCQAVHAGVVVMDPCTGQVLAMAGKSSAPGLNPCRERLYPAASVFKIVTATAAVEVCELNPEASLSFCGNKYTLYHSQIRSSGGQAITLKDSFAQSVNPVFGKLGASNLGGETLEAYAMGYGFNQVLGFDLPAAVSVAPVPGDAFGLAEMASGFNRRTLMTPLHGAALVSAVLNEGILPEPGLVTRVVRDDGMVVYHAGLSPVTQVADPATCRKIREMMLETVASGTGRKAFRGVREDSVLKNLAIGGKTGSINNDSGEIRYDWFVGFGEMPGRKSVAVAAVVAHGKYLGTRSGEFARQALRWVFAEDFAERS